MYVISSTTVIQKRPGIVDIHLSPRGE